MGGYGIFRAETPPCGNQNFIHKFGWYPIGSSHVTRGTRFSKKKGDSGTLAFVPKSCSKKENFAEFLECVNDGINYNDIWKANLFVNEMIKKDIISWLAEEKDGAVDFAEKIGIFIRSPKTPDNISDQLLEILKQAGLEEYSKRRGERKNTPTP
ncbi:MAG: hypothetical protein ABIH83_00255 [Candidatus Micrarchaeota archaeon]